MALKTCVGILEPFVDCEEGIAFKADNGNFWSCILRGDIYFIEAAKETKDPWCKFKLTKTSDGKIHLQDRRGVYLSRVDRDGVQHIEASKPSPDICCLFQAFTVNGKVALKADSEMFVSRVHRDNKQNIEAAKEGADPYCFFSPAIGDPFSPQYEILGVQMGKHGEQPGKPINAAKISYDNKTTISQKHIFTLSWETTNRQTTAWKKSWGIGVSISVEVPFLKLGSTVSYNSETSKETSVEKKVNMTESIEVVIPSKKQVIVTLIVFKTENATVPFTATIQKTTADGHRERFTEEGVWTGMTCDDLKIVVEEKDL